MNGLNMHTGSGAGSHGSLTLVRVVWRTNEPLQCHLT